MKPRESSHLRRMRREVQDATALSTMVRAFEDCRGDSPDPFSVEVIQRLYDGWEQGTLTDRIRLPASDPLVPRAERIGFSWGRGERFRNRSQRVTA